MLLIMMIIHCIYNAPAADNYNAAAGDIYSAPATDDDDHYNAAC